MIPGTFLHVQATNVGITGATGTVSVYGSYQNFGDEKSTLLQDTFSVPGTIGANVVNTFYAMGDGELYSISAQSNLSVGQMFVLICVRAGHSATSGLLMTLASGYAGGNVGVAYPLNALRGKQDVPGAHFELNLPDDVGNILFSNLSSRLVWLYEVSFKLTTAAGGGVRRVYLEKYNNPIGVGSEFWPAVRTQAGGLTRKYSFVGRQVDITTPILTTVVLEEFNGTFLIGAQNDFIISAENVDPADSFTEVFIAGQTWSL